MASGKKGKKTKGKTFALNDFLHVTPGPVPSVPVRKANVNWADDVDDYDSFDSKSKANLVLPTAPKSARDYDDVDGNIPKEPPYIAYLSNLPYDVDDDEIAEFFGNLRISNMRIPKDDRLDEPPKLKGFGYIEFEDRDSLIEALVIPDTTLKNRRIRIEVATNFDNDKRRGGGRMDMNRDRERSEAPTGNWRDLPRVTANAEPERRGFSRDRDWEDRDRSGGGSWRDATDRPSFRDDRFSRNDRDSSDRRGFRRFDDKDDRPSSFSRDREDRPGGGFSRDRDDKSGGGFSRDRDDRSGGFSRDRDDRSSGFSRDRDDRPSGFSRDRDDGPRGFSRDREDRPSGFSRDRDSRPGGFSRDQDDRSGGFSRATLVGDEGDDKSEPKQRRKLVLAPRTKPAEQVTTEVVPSSSIFGNAKPVDTSVIERQIEERLAKENESKASRNITNGESLRDSSKDRCTNTEGKRVSRDSSSDRPSRERYRDMPKDTSTDRISNKSTDRISNKSHEGSGEEIRGRSRTRSGEGAGDDIRDEENEVHKEQENSKDRPRERSMDESKENTMERSRESSTDKQSEKGSYDGNRSRTRYSSNESQENKKNEKDHINNKSPRHSVSEDKDNKEKTQRKSESDKKSTKIDTKHEKSAKREKHEMEMPRLKEPEPPNIAVNNKFAFLQEDSE